MTKQHALEGRESDQDDRNKDIAFGVCYPKTDTFYMDLLNDQKAEKVWQ